MFGVSPAFVLSLYGENFTPRNYVQAAKLSSDLGFQGLQGEIFSLDQIPAWLKGGALELSKALKDNNLKTPQFVAHVLMDQFSSPEGILKGIERDTLLKLAEIVSILDSCSIFTLPLGAWRSGSLQDIDNPKGSYLEYLYHFEETIAFILDILNQYNLKLGLEIPPYSFLGSSQGVKLLCDRLGAPNLGLNFDTGHAWACKEALELIPYRLSGRIFGTHLCDNLGNENLKLPPGEGTIPWKGLLHALEETGYQGSLDLEIRCSAFDVKQKYTQALHYLSNLKEGRSAVHGFN